MTVRAKFICTSKTEELETGRLQLTVVTDDGSPDNAAFFKYTPAGSIDLHVVNPEALKQFTVGDKYFVDFTPFG